MTRTSQRHLEETITTSGHTPHSDGTHIAITNPQNETIAYGYLTTTGRLAITIPKLQQHITNTLDLALALDKLSNQDKQ